MRFGTWIVRRLERAGSLVTVSKELKVSGKETTRKTKMDLGEIGWGDVDWIGLTQDTD
jgi:hypothetical protein